MTGGLLARYRPGRLVGGAPQETTRERRHHDFQIAPRTNAMPAAIAKVV